MGGALAWGDVFFEPLCQRFTGAKGFVDFDTFMGGVF